MRIRVRCSTVTFQWEFKTVYVTYTAYGPPFPGAGRVTGVVTKFPYGTPTAVRARGRNLSFGPTSPTVIAQINRRKRLRRRHATLAVVAVVPLRIQIMHR